MLRLITLYLTRLHVFALESRQKSKHRRCALIIIVPYYASATAACASYQSDSGLPRRNEMKTGDASERNEMKLLHLTRFDGK